ncbi:MAG TPA: ammonium transporter [Sphingomonas sp.]|uniref:ammonium transporter n=1 Tax=Sphingomonas sp. TaxID=28214 RepID=UPI002CA0EB98|nr:ammonium transporter [Sphingomonas sp.]HMI19339.1 ammonium transporter [Sphingomonas sp.]
MNKEIKAGLIWAGGILAISLGAVTARKLGYVDGDTVMRLVMGINGLLIVWYGNRIPKTVIARSAHARQAQRVAGWSQVISGLIYTGLFLFAPVRMAALVGAGAVFAGVVITLGYCLTLRDRRKPA